MARAGCFFTTVLGVLSVIVSTRAEICWHPKRYNNMHPSSGSSIDGEQNPKAAELAKICPTGNNSTLAIRCYDNHDNMFSGTQTVACPGSPGTYLLTCDATHGGMLCAPENGTTHCTCPDYSAQFGCECAPGMSGSENGSDQLRVSAVWAITVFLMMANFVMSN